jgi:uncharacterized protein (TIGR02246 family)
MRTMLFFGSALVVLIAFASPARADATEDGRAVSDAFQKAVASGDVDAIMALYRDDARVIWPGQGEEAKGKAAITELAKRLVGATKGSEIVLESQDSLPLGDGFIANVGHWKQSFTTPEGERRTVLIRTSEVLQKTDGKWLYLVDHASVGAAPPAATRRRGPRRVPPH